MSRVVMLSGPAGSGKSSSAAAWAARGETPRAMIDADALRLLVKAGAAHPENGWTDETQRQWDTAMDLWKAMVRVYKEHEIDCLVDIYAPPCPPALGDTFMTDLQVERIILLPSLDVCLERNRVRNRTPFLKDEDVRRNYLDFEGCVREHRPDNVIDNGSLTLVETVNAIEKILK